MKVSRYLCSALLLSTLLTGAVAGAEARYKAVVFDYLVLLDGNSLVRAAERAFPGHGTELVRTWRSKQFEYGFLRSITGRQTDFFQVTADALVYTTRSMKLELAPDTRQRLLQSYLDLKPWPDAEATLRKLKQQGVRVIVVSNFSPPMLDANAKAAGFTGLIDDLVSTQRNHSFKPEPRAYALGAERLGLPTRDILYVAFGGWDAYGAKNFGYTTYWVNRLGLPAEELGLPPDATSTSLDGLLRFVEGARSDAG